MDAEQLAEILANLLESGFSTPIHFTAIALNGSVIAGRYVREHDALTATILAEHFEEGALVTPINLMFVGSNGMAARVVIESNVTVQPRPS